MSKSRKISDSMRSVAQWHRDKAIKFWLAGKWPEYIRHIRIADKIVRR